ncbi:MAG TPA: MBL fold metallo-hydrolase [Terriglobales bacterium]|nr:MBL fold metallo-hydrolase [Terriglobales bacterium]
MDRTLRIAVLSIVCLLLMRAAVAKPKPLQIYFIDVEGGQATLVVGPSRESVLIDTGWAGSRDAPRIVAAAIAVGLKRIDYVLITHYHQDHVGGVAGLLQRIPVGLFVDHGPNAEDSDSARNQYAAYEKATEHSKRIHLMPGEGLPLKGITLQVLTAAGGHITDPLPGAGEANPYCRSEAAKPDPSENAQSLGVLISYGKFRFLDLGDLTEQKELDLVCPNNLIGTVSLYLTTHHGMAPDNPKALVWALQARVAIMNNGAHKGGHPEAWQIVHDSPGLVDLWQLHYAVDGGKDHNVADDLIANVDEKSDGHYIKVAAEPDGTFTVSNSRNGVSRKYGER